MEIIVAPSTITHINKICGIIFQRQQLLSRGGPVRARRDRGAAQPSQRPAANGTQNR